MCSNFITSVFPVKNVSPLSLHIQTWQISHLATDYLQKICQIETKVAFLSSDVSWNWIEYLFWKIPECPMNCKFNITGSWSNMYCFLTSRRLKAIFSGHICFLIIYYLSDIWGYKIILLLQFSLIFKMRLFYILFSCARARWQAAARECHYVTRGHVTGRQVRQTDWVPPGRSRRRRTGGQLKQDTDCQRTDKVGHKLLLMAELASFWESLLPLPRHRQPVTRADVTVRQRRWCDN